MLFDSHNIGFLLGVANKKPLSTKPTIAGIEISRWKGIIFYGYKGLYPRPPHRENVVCCEE